MMLGIAMTYDTTPKAWFMKEIIDQPDFIKMQNFCSAKDKVKRVRGEATDWENVSVHLLSKTCKNS